MEAAVVSPLTFRPSLTMTPAHRKPTTATTPWTDTRRVGRHLRCRPTVPVRCEAHEDGERRRRHAHEAVGAHPAGTTVGGALVTHQHAQHERAEQVQADERIGSQEAAAPIQIHGGQGGHGEGAHCGSPASPRASRLFRRPPGCAAGAGTARIRARHYARRQPAGGHGPGRISKEVGTWSNAWRSAGSGHVVQADIDHVQFRIGGKGAAVALRSAASSADAGVRVLHDLDRLLGERFQARTRAPSGLGRCLAHGPCRRSARRCRVPSSRSRARSWRWSRAAGGGSSPSATRSRRLGRPGRARPGCPRARRPRGGGRAGRSVAVALRNEIQHGPTGSDPHRSARGSCAGWAQLPAWLRTVIGLRRSLTREDAATAKDKGTESRSEQISANCSDVNAKGAPVVRSVAVTSRRGQGLAVSAVAP